MVLGVAGIRAFAEDVGRWGVREDAEWVASFNARAIEKFGNGGGNFRRLYAGFLEWAHALDASLCPGDAAALCTQAADGWTEVSAHLARASQEGAASDGWQAAARRASEIADLEQTLFERLRDFVG